MNLLLPLLALGFAPPAPALSCPAPLAAKGDVRGGPPLTHAFELANRAGHTIRIAKVEAGCGCVKRTLSATELKPGETGTVTLEVNTLTQPDGPNRWQAIVTYSVDDPARSSGELILTVAANLSREVVVSPPQIAFSTTNEASQAITLTDRRGKTLTVVKATSSSPHLTAAIGAKVEKSQSVQVKLSADAPAGQRDELLILQTDDPAYPEFRVPVRVNKKAPGQVTAAPEEIAVRLGPVQEEVSTLVQLRAPDGKTIRIKSAESDFGAAGVKFSSEAGPVATVRISVGGIAASLPGSCRVKIRLAEPAGQEVIVPVSWTSGPKK